MIFNVKAVVIPAVLLVGTLVAVPDSVHIANAVGTRVYDAPCQGNDVKNDSL